MAQAVAVVAIARFVRGNRAVAVAGSIPLRLF